MDYIYSFCYFLLLAFYIFSKNIIKMHSIWYTQDVDDNCSSLPLIPHIFVSHVCFHIISPVHGCHPFTNAREFMFLIVPLTFYSWSEFQINQIFFPHYVYLQLLMCLKHLRCSHLRSLIFSTLFCRTTLKKN